LLFHRIIIQIPFFVIPAEAGIQYIVILIRQLADEGSAVT